MNEMTDERGTHPVSVTHLVMGLVFLGAAAVWGLTELDLVEIDGARWIVPLVFVVAGAAGLMVTVGRGLRRRRPRPPTQQPTPADQEDTEILG